MPKLIITDVVQVFQFQRTGNTENYQIDPTYIKVNACISPTGTDVQSGYGDVGSYQMFEIFLYDVGLQINNADKIVTANAQEYLVDGKPYVINNQYLQYVRILARQVV